MNRTTATLAAAAAAVVGLVVFTRDAGQPTDDAVNAPAGGTQLSDTQLQDLAELNDVDLGGFQAGTRAFLNQEQQADGVERGFTGL